MRPWILPLVCLTACTSHDSRPASAVIDTLPGGIPRVTSTAPTAWSNTNGWKLIEIDSIAPPAGSPGELINPASMAVDGSGRVYVADQSPLVIKQYDSTGAFIRTIGREGEGPGEFRAAYIAVRGNRLMVHDPRLQRTALFDTSGALVRSFHSVGIVWADRVELDAAQRAVLPVMEQEPSDSEPGSVETYARFDSLGQPIDTIRVPRVTDEHVWRILRNGRVSSVVSIPFAPATRAAFGPDSGVIYGATSDYSIVFGTGQGDTSRIVRKSWEPVPVSDSLRQRVFQGVLSAMSQRLGEAAVADVFRLSDIPSTEPVWNNLQSDDQGNIWVLRMPPEGSYTIDLIDSTGRWLGTLPMPWRTFSAAGIEIVGGRVYVSTENGDGLPVIRRWVVQDGQGQR